MIHLNGLAGNGPARFSLPTSCTRTQKERAFSDEFHYSNDVVYILRFRNAVEVLFCYTEIMFLYAIDPGFETEN